MLTEENNQLLGGGRAWYGNGNGNGNDMKQKFNARDYFD